ncbi:MAG: sigma 54 modulation/S30EA ribosomal C-terminal domain-containing protein [Bryobacteraceae bacterium]|nr:sigma 54 modulation/S30EA ribosomal C-terminal domain-containing protein [Bryobacteraceae bacterium]
MEAAEETAGGRKAKKKKAAPAGPEEAEELRPARVVRASSRANGKPMTLEEAMLAMEDGRDYLVYRDADTDRLQILIRRSDGAVDLVEA